MSSDQHLCVKLVVHHAVHIGIATNIPSCKKKVFSVCNCCELKLHLYTLIASWAISRYFM
jgi:hypothetical protein